MSFAGSALHVSWGIANGFKWYRSSALNYDPKFHLKHSLDPLDLYVRHTSKFINPILRRLLPLLEPTRNDKTLPKFSNYANLWARQHPFPTPLLRTMKTLATQEE